MGKALELPESLRISIAESLYHVTSRDDRKGELLGLCPVHGEKNASFSYNYINDVCFCQTCKASGDLIKLWIMVKGISNLKEGFISFCREYGLGDGKGGSVVDSKTRTPDKKKEAPRHTESNQPVKDLTSIFRQMPPLPPEWIRELKKKRGWSEEVIKKYDLRLQTLYQAKDGIVKKIFWKPNRIVIPIYNESGKVINMRMYRPGPARNDNDPKIISWASGSGEARLFPAKPDPEGFILLCEGEPDDLCALSLGYNAITQTSKPKTWKKEQLDVFKGRDVVIAFDADLAGQAYMNEFAIPALEKVAKSIKILEWPDFMGRLESGKWPDDHGQDLTDFIVKHGKSTADLDELIAAAKNHKTEEIEEDYAEDEIDSQAFDFFVRGVNDRLSFKARRLAERLCDLTSILSDPESGLLYKWNNRCWEIYHEDHLKKTAIKLLGEESQTSRVNDAVNQARVLSTISEGRAVNDKLDWLCLKNGMLNIKTLELVPHDPSFYATVELPVEYNPESESICKLWLLYLKTNIKTQEVINQIQEFFGYCLYRRTHIAKCLLLLGPGSDGKSTMLAVLRELVGAANCASVGFEDLDDNFMRASLYNKSVNISTEIGSKAIDSPYFKAITSGDPISASFKFKDNFEFKPFCKLVFAANKLPRSLDNSDGYFRRILPIQFKRQFFENDPDTDPFLEGKLISELSEIFHWALVGLHRLLENGKFTDCDETQRLLLGYRRLNNPVVCFLDECCDLNDGLSAKKSDVYEAYKKFCNISGYSSFSKENFWREMWAARQNLQEIRKRLGDKREYYVSGLGLSSVEDAA